LSIIAVVVAASLFVNLAYVNVNAQKIDVMLDIFNKKFDTNKSLLVGDVFTFETSNIVTIDVSDRRLDRIE